MNCLKTRGSRMSSVALVTALTCALSPMFTDSGHAESVSESCQPLSGASLAQERALPGTNEWQPEGDKVMPNTPQVWLGADSLTCGESVRVFAAAESNFSLEVYRIGDYRGGSGNLKFQQDFTAKTVTTKAALPLSEALIGLPRGTIKPSRLAKWKDGYPLFRSATAAGWPLLTSIPTTGWPAGAYVVVGRSLSGNNRRTLSPFFLHSKIISSPLVAVAPTLSWQAYNNWGVASLYSYPNAKGLAVTNLRGDSISLKRPYVNLYTANDFPAIISAWAPLFDRLDIPTTWITSLDVDAWKTRIPTSPRAMVLIGHDEYATGDFQTALNHWRIKGKNLLVFSGNTMYHRGSLSEKRDWFSVRKARSQLHAKDGAFHRSWLFADLRLRPEDTIGVVFGCVVSDVSKLKGGDFSITDSDFWVWRNQKLARGTRLPGLIGYEMDVYKPSANGYRVAIPAGSQVKCANRQTMKYSFVYAVDRKSSAGIVNVGFTNWTMYLDSPFRYVPSALGSVSARNIDFVSRSTEQMLKVASAGPLGKSQPVR